MLSSLRRRKRRVWTCCLMDDRSELEEMEGGKRGRYIQCNFMKIGHNYYLTFFFGFPFMYIYIVPIFLPPFPLVSVSLSEKGSICKRSQCNVQQLEPLCQIVQVIFFCHCFLYIFLIIQHWFKKHSYPSSCLLLILLICSLLALEFLQD